MTTLVPGIAALLAALFASLAGAEIQARRYFDRPTIARNRLFDPVLSLTKWALILAGIALVGSASRRSAAIAAGALLALWGYRRLIRSVRFQGWLLKRDYHALRRSHPGRPEKEILYELVCRRNPRWGEELIEQMVIDYPTIDDLVPMIARMERGFRGFK